ncbi:MAG: Geranyl-CoA carboxylase biotin-containing subunit [uncultured Nocardioidaceae bacterium]|uniref:Geranyl-CoA carboxylase biotin-containing subunit n=1 Tax=uncultured Nocardioidaceae bacterium TaxID=253824 RepID=A0A6J4N3W8_9ACTN|nr:MAG: Geranyl-CoA carboxylase biotin-containing subunit [uncultured Nocardioidaceae bacterium]
MVPTSSTTVRRLLVANRGEIARRVFRTCRDLGIETVAVHSDADAGMPFVAEADLAVRLPGSTPAETYLRGDLVVEAARRTGADAVHPGYGFLSENAGFARQVVTAGLTWVGPAPESMEQMGSKVEAKKLMEAAGVPVLANLDPDSVTEADLPVLVKASAGGGGRGMRVAHLLDSLAAQVESARAEAASAFGDGTVFVETYVERGRHVEVQVMGDQHGKVAVLGERDCSLQRRHQKVVEEAPAPGLSASLRSEMHEAARRAAEAVGYVGAGTVEFLLDPEREQFFFLEMNTRLQVEHPVTELVTGLDLVALQIGVAEGRSLTELAPGHSSSTDPGHHGHAVEVRLYAEDPAQDWQPQSGLLTRFDVPGATAEFTNPPAYGIRLDSGVRAGNEIGTHYDAMIAKVMAWAPSREEACRRLAAALRRARIHGLRTNRDLLVELLSHPQFLAGEVSTGFIADAHLSSTEPRGPGLPRGLDNQAMTLFAAAVALVEDAAERRPVQRRVPTGWRNVVSGPHTVSFDIGGTEFQVGWLATRDGYSFVDVYGEVEGGRVTSVGPLKDGRRVVVERDGVTTPYDVFVDGNRVDVESHHGHVSLTRKPRFVDPADQVAEGSLLAPMPATVVAVRAAVGDELTSGQPVLVLEAMKMQHTIASPSDGVVVELQVQVGDQVTAGDVLAVVEPVGSQVNEDESEAPA